MDRHPVAGTTQIGTANVNSAIEPSQPNTLSAMWSRMAGAAKPAVPSRSGSTSAARELEPSERGDTMLLPVPVQRSASNSTSAAESPQEARERGRVSLLEEQ